MEPRRRPRDEVELPMSENEATANNEEVEAPTPRQQDWDRIRGAKIRPDSASEDGAPGDGGIEKDGQAPDEDDDNAYQNSDEALPDDAEEAAIARDLSRRGGPTRGEQVDPALGMNPGAPWSRRAPSAPAFLRRSSLHQSETCCSAA